MGGDKHWDSVIKDISYCQTRLALIKFKLNALQRSARHKLLSWIDERYKSHLHLRVNLLKDHIFFCTKWQKCMYFWSCRSNQNKKEAKVLVRSWYPPSMDPHLFHSERQLFLWWQAAGRRRPAATRSTPPHTLSYPSIPSSIHPSEIAPSLVRKPALHTQA